MGIDCRAAVKPRFAEGRQSALAQREKAAYMRLQRERASL
jgi:hypothetical protein